MYFIFLFGAFVLLLTVGVYCGDGVDQASYAGCLGYFSKSWPAVIVNTLTKDSIASNCLSGYQVFMMPGGRDQPYVRDLGERLSRLIREFVECGGLYIGICAGAYFAGKSISFAKGTRLEICAQRQLCFYPDVIQGPYLKDYEYDSQKGACMAQLRGQDCAFSCYYNGGPCFKNAKELEGVCVKACYDHTGLADPAVVVCKVKRGYALLSGVHFELDMPEQECRDQDKKRLFFHNMIKEILTQR